MSLKATCEMKEDILKDLIEEGGILQGGMDLVGDLVRCRRDICLISSPPLRTGFGSQNTGFSHEYILLLFSLFLLHENGLQFFRKHYD